MKIESYLEYQKVFDTREEAMEFGENIHNALVGEPCYIRNTVIINCTDNPKVVKVTVFLDDFHGDTEARNKLLKKIMEAIDDD